MKIVAAVSVVIALLGGSYVLYASFGKSPSVPISEGKDAVQEISLDNDVESQLDETLNVLMTIHYVSVIDDTPSSPDTVILDELGEAMNDLNKLKGLTYKAERLAESENEAIATTGLVLQVSVLQLIGAYESWIEYLRGIDIYDIDVSEFQYQLALFQTSTHDVYLKLIEGASLLPFVAVQFAEEAGGENSVDEELKNYFLARIDDLFGDILVEDDQFHEETNNRYAIAVLVRGYRDFFGSSD